MSDKKKEFKRLMEQFLKGASNLPCLFCEDENTVMSGFFIPAFAFPVDGIISAGRVYGYSMCQKCTDHFGPDSAKYDEAERKIIMGEGSYQYIGRTTFPFAEGLLSDGTAKEGTSACDARDDKPSACRDGLSSRRTRQRIREDMSSRQKHGTENILLHDIKSYDELKSYDRNKILQSETGYYIRQWHKLEKENPDVIISDGQQNNYVFVMRITDNARCKIAVERNDIRLNNILFLIDDKYVSIEEILRTASISMIGMKEPDEEAFKRHVISILSRAEGPYCNRKRIMYMETVHGDEIPIQKVDGRWHFYDSDFIKGYFTIYENGEKRDMDMDSLREYFRRNFCKGFDLGNKIEKRDDYYEIAQKILTDAYMDKHYTVPNEAIVDFQNDLINHVKILSAQKTYTLVFCSKEGDWKDIVHHSFDVVVSKTEPIFFSSPAFPPHIRDWFFLVSACIIRDFVVADMVAYEKRVKKERRRVGSGKNRKLVKKKSIRYLPRKKIVFEKYLSLNDFTSKVRVKISPHLVRGHLRNLPTYWGASEKAKEAAYEFGFTLKEGQTFVRPHKRGEAEQLRTYRSESALQIIFEGDK